MFYSVGNPYLSAKRSWFVQFGQESCPVGEYFHSEQLWMPEKVSAALKTTPTTIPQTPHISKNPQKKKIWFLSSSAKSLVQLGNTFTQSGCGCLKKCLQLSTLLPLPSHKLHTFPKTTKKKKFGFVQCGQESCPVWPRVLSS